MNVSLTPELESWIQAKVESGLYSSASEVVREALRLLAREELSRRAHHDELRRIVERGVQDADHGRLRAFDRNVIEDVRRRGRRRLGLDD